MTKSIAIIGGGPSGFMAGIVAAENSDFPLTIHIYEKDIPLKSILFTGNGRCNLANNTFDFKELASNFPRGEKFLYSVFSRFGTKKTVEWFENHGVDTYVQPDNRIFPETDRAATIREMFLNYAKNYSIKIFSHSSIKNIKLNDEKFEVITENSALIYDKIVMATGGNSNKSQNSGYKIAENFGHKIQQLKPSLAALITKNNPENSAGISVKNAEVTAEFDNKKITSNKGDFIFTHKGISGPLAFKTSAYCAYCNYSFNTPLVLKINFVPEIQDLNAELLAEINSNPNKSIDNILKKYAPKSLIVSLLDFNSIVPDKKAHQISKEERKSIIKLLTETRLFAVSPEPDGEIVTAGGISLSEVNPKTMESKITKGLYFCGEILDIDGLTGGFNLQNCWSTGYICGINL